MIRYEEFVNEMQFVEVLHQRLWKKAKKVFISAGHDREDLVQESWTKAWITYQNYKGNPDIKSIKRLINTSVANHLMDILDKAMIVVEHGALKNHGDSIEEKENNINQNSIWLKNYYENKNKFCIIADIISVINENLTDIEAVVIKEYLLNGKTLQNIADEHGEFLRTRRGDGNVTHVSVYNIYNKALEKLKDIMLIQKED